MKGMHQDDFAGLARFDRTADGQNIEILVEPSERDIAAIAFRLLGLEVEEDEELGSLRIVATRR